jgi:hypothetical protein
MKPPRIACRQLQLYLLICSLKHSRSQIDAMNHPSADGLADMKADEGLIRLVDENANVYVRTMYDADQCDFGIFRRRRFGRRRVASYWRHRGDRGAWTAGRETEKRGGSRVIRKDSSGIAKSGLPLPEWGFGAGGLLASRRDA